MRNGLLIANLGELGFRSLANCWVGGDFVMERLTLVWLREILVPPLSAQREIFGSAKECSTRENTGPALFVQREVVGDVEEGPVL